MSSPSPSVVQLVRAVKIAEQIETLQAELAGLLGGVSGGNGPVSETRTKRAYTKKSGPVKLGKRKYTRKAQVTEAEVATAADTIIAGLLGKTKWKNSKKGDASAVAPAKKKRTMSPEAREKIAAAQRKRWAKVKKAKKTKAKEEASKAE